MIDAAERESDTGVHLQGRRRLIARAALIADRLERVGSDRPPPGRAPAVSGPRPTLADLALAETIDEAPDDEDAPVSSLH